ncbi:MAG: fructose-bisphosphate aldolase class I [Oligoflexales bacterium]|nr:fructose-bisphosphate aldolase class I [Oligoflexales bacterium]
MGFLQTTAQALVAPGKGILAADESTKTITKRFSSIGIESSVETRQAYRQMLFTSPGFGEYISGVILYDETIRQSSTEGKSFVKILQASGAIPGIKVDTGAIDLPAASGEKITEGLDGLRQRLQEYKKLGAGFAKWRAVINIDDANGLPSDYCLKVNADALARYAALCQENEIVPIVEPEVIMDGKHSVESCYKATKRALNALFNALYDQRVQLDGLLLKPNMVVAGTLASRQASITEVAELSLRCFQETVPSAVCGIVFLSGGQSDELATAHLSAMNASQLTKPWKLSFSYGRALQTASLNAWAGKKENVSKGQAAFLHRAKLNSAACFGKYSAAMEKDLR